MKIGVLDIQGSVVEHVSSLEKCGAEVVRVKGVADLDGCKGLVLPGGESTAIGKLLVRFGLRDEILRRYEAGDLGIFGTCAGAILLARGVHGGAVDGLGLMDISIARNAYGSQLDSFEGSVEWKPHGCDSARIPAVFIRAPKILKADCEVLASVKNEPVCVVQGKLMAATFHPEMTEDLRVHEYFLQLL